MDTNEFIQKAHKIHNQKYDYSQSTYKLSRIKLKINCPIHGTFEQTPNDHLSGKGCRECKRATLSRLLKMSQETFLEKCKAVHGNKYDYSLSLYQCSKNKIIIICREHGQFKQSPTDHLSGKGCSECGKAKQITQRLLTQEEFIERARCIHGEKYNYSKSCYQTMHDKIIIECPHHGYFEQIPLNHLHGKNGCPGCKESKGENKIRQFLESQNLNFVYQWKSESCKLKRCLPFDFMIKINDNEYLIEFHGQQHYKIATGIWAGSLEQLMAIKQRDLIKNTWCKNNAIPLLVIKYTDYELIESKIKKFLSLT